MDLTAVRRPVDASVRRTPPSSRSLTIRIEGRRPEQTNLQVAVYDAESGCRLSLARVPREPGAGLKIDRLPRRALLLRLGRDGETIRQQYISGTTVAAGEAPISQVSIQLPQHSLRLRLEDAAQSGQGIAGVPVWIRRKDDPNWRFATAAGDGARGAIRFSDAQGELRFDDLEDTVYTLHFEGFAAEAEARLQGRPSDFDPSRPLRGRRR